MQGKCEQIPFLVGELACRNDDNSPSCCNQYAMEGLKCRKFMLAQEVMSGVTAWDRQCAKCDNCRFRQDGMKHKVEISDLVFDLLNSVTEFDSLTDLSKAACCLLDSSSLCIRKKALIFTLLKFPKGKSKEFAILNSLSRFFTVRNHFDETVPKTLRLATWRSQLETKRLSIYLQYCKLDGETQQYQRILEPGQAWFDVDQKITAEPESKDEFSAKPNYPYLVQFELRRLEFSLEAKSVPNSLSAACELVYDRAGQGHVPYIHFLKEAEKANCLPASNKLFFRAELQSDGRLKFCEPEQVHPRRIFRMFGSDRFLDISVSSDVHETKILDFFRHPILVGGRTFRFLWCKKDKSPQAYVLFAEQGCGIPVSEECTVSEVIRRCIPQSYNPDLTLGKWAKRMKMSFSRTTEGCKLPPGSVMMLEDFGRAGVTEVDGAGLVSRSALEAIWEGYSKNSGRDPQDKVCPSGFQGRLAG